MQKIQLFKSPQEHADFIGFCNGEIRAEFTYRSFLSVPRIERLILKHEARMLVIWFVLAQGKRAIELKVADRIFEQWAKDKRMNLKNLTRNDVLVFACEQIKQFVVQDAISIRTILN